MHDSTAWRCSRNVAVALSILLWLPALAAWAAADGERALRIEFLDVEAAAAAIVDDAGDPYFERLQPLEMRAKSGSPLEGDLAAQREAFRRRYASAVMEFTDAEKKLVRRGVERVQPFLAERYSLFADRPWRLIKVSRVVESGLPHTRGPCIVVSELMLKWLGSASGDRAEQALSDLLIHEQVHVLQRAHGELFDALYTGVWGLRSGESIDAAGWLIEAQVINPDGVDRWVVPVPDGESVRWIWPTLVIEAPEEGGPNLMQHMRKIGVEVTRNEGGFEVRREEDGTPVHTRLSEVPGYRALFPFTNNTYHPHEITADALAKLALAGIHDLPAERRPSGPEIEALESWFRQNLQRPRGKRR